MPEPPERSTWPHAPSHRLSQSGTYFITASTYQRAHHFHTPKRLDVLQRGLLKLTSDFGWHLEAWAIFSNHYHFIAHSPSTISAAENLPVMLRDLHSQTASWINKLDGTPKRSVWFNYWETRLTIQPSYLARLHYVHQNPVSHRLVPVANQYPWCSAAWFERTASPPMVDSIYRFKIDRLKISDEYEPLMPGNEPELDTEINTRISVDNRRAP